MPFFRGRRNAETITAMQETPKGKPPRVQSVPEILQIIYRALKP